MGGEVDSWRLFMFFFNLKTNKYDWSIFPFEITVVLVFLCFSLYLCTFTLAVSGGAVFLLPFSIISNEILLSFPKNYYIQWLNGSLIHGQCTSHLACALVLSQIFSHILPIIHIVHMYLICVSLDFSILMSRLKWMTPEDVSQVDKPIPTISRRGCELLNSPPGGIRVHDSQKKELCNARAHWSLLRNHTDPFKKWHLTKKRCFFRFLCTDLTAGSSCRSVEPGVTVLQPVSVRPDALCVFLLGVRGLRRIQKGKVSHAVLNEK